MSEIAQRIARAIVGHRAAAAAAAPFAVEQILPLDPRRRLYVLRCGARRLVLLTGGPQDLSLGWLPVEPAGDLAP